MANFVALTPPLGQQPWGPVNLILPVANPNASTNVTNANNLPVVALPANIGIEDIGYPALNSFYRALILSKYPGFIFADPDQLDVLPCPDPSPTHIQDTWAKYDEILRDCESYSVDLAVAIRRELSIWLAELETSNSSVVLIVAGGDSMNIDVANPKKRARRETSEVDTTMKAPSPKKAKTGKKSSKKFKQQTQTRIPMSTLKLQYDAAFPVDAVVSHDMAVYIMAKNYIDLYAKSDEEYVERVRRIIAEHGMELLAQRCAKFFAWAMKMPISKGPIATPTDLVAASKADPTSAFTTVSAPVNAIQANAASTTSTDPTDAVTAIADPANAIQTTDASTARGASNNSDDNESGIESPAPSKNDIRQELLQGKHQHLFERFDSQVPGDFEQETRARQASEGSEPFPDYVEPDLSEYANIMEAIYNYGAGGSVGGSSESEEEIINVRPLNQRPTMRFEPSALSSRLPGFLAEMAAENEKLEESIRSGELSNFEAGEGDEGEHIEMNLGLGVLEHVEEEL